jgi:hypothetical protein
MKQIKTYQIEQLDQFRRYVEQKGGFHDCEIGTIDWNVSSTTFQLYMEDSEVNFLGLPEYIGPNPLRMVFEGVSSVQVELMYRDKTLDIYETEVTLDENKPRIEFKISPQGRISLDFSAVTLKHAGEHK